MKEKRYVEVDFWDSLEEIRADGKRGVFVKKYSLSDLINKEFPDLRERLAKALHGVRMETATMSMFVVSWEESKQQTKDFYYAQADAILDIFKEKL